MKISRPPTENSVTDHARGLAGDDVHNGPRGPRVLHLTDLADFSWTPFRLGVREPRPQLGKIGTANSDRGSFQATVYTCIHTSVNGVVFY